MSLTHPGDLFPRLWLFHLFSHFVAGTRGPSGPLLNSTPHSGNTLCNNTVCQTPLSVQHLTSRCAHIIVFRPLNSCLPLHHEKWRSSHPLSCPTIPHPPPCCCHSTLCHIDKAFFVLSFKINLPAVVQVEIRAARTDCSLPLSLSFFFFQKEQHRRGTQRGRAGGPARRRALLSFCHVGRALSSSSLLQPFSRSPPSPRPHISLQICETLQVYHSTHRRDSTF